MKCQLLLTIALLTMGSLALGCGCCCKTNKCCEPKKECSEKKSCCTCRHHRSCNSCGMCHRCHKCCKTKEVKVAEPVVVQEPEAPVMTDKVEVEEEME